MMVRTLIALLAALTGCTGSIGSTPSEGGPDDIPVTEGTAPTPPGALPPEAFICDASTRGTGEGVGHRLSSQEVVASLRQVFGSVLDDASVQSAVATVPQDAPASREHGFDHTIANVVGLLSVAEAIGVVVASDANVRARLLNCAEITDPACAQAVADDLAPRLYRRPLSAAERSQLLEFISAEGIEWGIASLIASPAFSQRLEIDGTVDDHRVRLSPSETATRLALRLTGAGPDDALLDAAREGRLETVQDLQREANRLMDTPLARDRLRTIILRWIDVDSVSDPHHAVASRFGIDGTGLGAEALEELRRFVDHVVFTERGDLRQLLSDKTAFPYTPRLAAIYGMDVSDGPLQFDDARGGLLLRAGTLMESGRLPHSVHRGVVFAQRILCSDLGAPPPGAEETAAMIADEHPEEMFANRQRVEAATAGPACTGCHAGLINPIGFALGQFGTLSEPRESELIITEDGTVLAEHPLETHVENVRLGDERVALEDGAALLQAVAESEVVRSCFAQRLFAQTRQRTPGVAGEDGCLLTDLIGSLRTTPLVEVFVESVANEDALYRSPFGEP